MSTKEIELSLVAITAREERDKLRKENADLKAKLDAEESRHAESSEMFQSKLDAAEACCKEMRDCFISIPDNTCECGQCLKIKHALSSYCGKGWIKSSELDKTIELLTQTLSYFPEENQEIHNEIARLQTLRGGTA